MPDGTELQTIWFTSRGTVGIQDFIKKDGAIDHETPIGASSVAANFLVQPVLTVKANCS
jgi:hypothetical protein